MRKGDIVRGYDGEWLATVIGVSKDITVRWETGPLKGREALVSKGDLKVAAKGGSK